MGKHGKTIRGMGLAGLVLLALVALASSGWWESNAAAAGTAESGGQEGLRVSGTAVLRVAPELAIVRLGYESRSRHARQAKLDNDEVMGRVIAAVQKLGVERKEIQTVQYSVCPRWEEFPTPTTRTLFWHVTHMLEIRVRKVGVVADVIDAASAAGADKVEDVVFAVESLHRYRARAREMAVAVAKDKARQLAQLTGARLGRLVHISDSTSTPYYWYGGRTAAMTANAQAVAEFPAAEVTAPDSVIAGGQVVVEAREELVYALQ